jgi:hypothetical protein
MHSLQSAEAFKLHGGFSIKLMNRTSSGLYRVAHRTIHRAKPREV